MFKWLQSLFTDDSDDWYIVYKCPMRLQKGSTIFGQCWIEDGIAIIEKNSKTNQKRAFLETVDGTRTNISVLNLESCLGKEL